MIRVLGTELRRSNARVLALLLILASVAGFAQGFDRWNEQWLVFSYYQAGNLFLLVPLALAGGAMLGRRERRTGAAELLSTTGRPRWQIAAAPAGALALAVTVVQLLALLAGAVVIGTAGGFLNVGGAVPALADIAILIGAAWAGFAAGRAWSSPALPPALAALALVIQVGAGLTAAHLRLHGLELVPQPPNFLWESANAPATLGRLGLGLGLALGSVLLVAGASWLSRAAGLATMAAGVAVIIAVNPTGTYGRYQVNTAAQELVCAEGTPQVCVTAVQAHQLDEVAPAARRALTLLAKLPGAPTRAVEWRAEAIGNGDNSQFWGTKPKAEPGTVLFALDGWGALTPGDVTASILNGAGTTWNGCEPGDTVATGAAGAWLLGGDSLPLRDAGYPYDEETDSQIRATVTALRKLPEREQVRRVTALRDAAAACRTDDLLALLTGKPST